MNIAIFTEMEKVDGQGRYWILHARWLREHGHEVVIFSPQSPMLDQIQGTGIEHVAIDSVRQGVALDYDAVLRDAGTLARECAARGIKAMIATAKLPFVMATHVFGTSLPIYLPILSDTYFLPESPTAMEFVRCAAREGRLFSPARSVARDLSARFGFSSDDVRCYRFPMDDRMRFPDRSRADVRASLGIADDEVFVLTITRLDIDKAPGIPHFSKAVEQLNNQGLRVKLVVVGDGTLGAQTQAQCRPGTIFTGTRYDLADLYHACDIYAGEGTTIYEAAMASRPVIITGTSWHPESPDTVFGIYAAHVVDHVFLDSTTYSPLVPYAEALLPLALDAELRRKLGESAFATVNARNGTDAVMPWIVDMLAGKPVESIIFDERAAFIITLPGGMADGIDAVGRLCAAHGDRLKIGVRFLDPVPYARTLALPIEHAQALARAVRRRIDDSTPHVHFDGRQMELGGLGGEAARALQECTAELPPTSFEPRFAFAPPRAPIYAVFAATASTASSLLQEVTLENEPQGAVVVWVPGASPAEGDVLVRAFEERTKGAIAFIPSDIPWTTIGRLLIAADRYVDDGSERFSAHRALVEQLASRA